MESWEISVISWEIRFGGLRCSCTMTVSTAVNLLPQQRALRLIGFCIVTDESIMQSRTKDEAMGKTKERLGKLMKNPTLEGNHENKAGRVQEKTGLVDWEALFNGIFRGKTIIECGMDRSVFQQGQSADSLFYIRRGKVKLTVISQQGKEVSVIS